MHIKRVFWRFKEWTLKGRMAPDLARKMLDVMSATPTISATTINSWGKSDKRTSLSNLYKRIWRRTALLNGTLIKDPYALDPLECWQLCILYHRLCWPLFSFGLLQKVKTLPELFLRLLLQIYNNLFRKSPINSPNFYTD